MATYKTPGVYLEEIPHFPPTITGVETALPAFIGYTEKAERDNTSLTLVPTPIYDFNGYVRLFGGPPSQKVTLWLDAQNNIADAKLNHAFSLYDSLRLFFDNGGKTCIIVSVGHYGEQISHPALAQGLAAIETLPKPTIIVMPEAVATEDHGIALYAEALAQCARTGNRMTICELRKTDQSGFEEEVSSFRSGIGSDNLMHGAVYAPWLNTEFSRKKRLGDITLKRKADESLIAPESLTNDETIRELIAEIRLAEQPVSRVRAPKASSSTSLNTTPDSEQLNQLLYQKFDLFRAWADRATSVLNTSPPSGAIAGLYARVDSHRGVWKSPANESLRSVQSPVFNINQEMQAPLNVHETGKSINAIRAFAGKGTLVYGARTLKGNDSEWRYISIRRLFNFVEASVYNSLQRFVVERNDATTWLRAQGMIENFLTTLWRHGALQGSKPEHAFFVKVGLNQSMTALDIEQGRMIIQIGMAPIRPAEFVIFRSVYQMLES